MAGSNGGATTLQRLQIVITANTSQLRSAMAGVRSQVTSINRSFNTTRTRLNAASRAAGSMRTAMARVNSAAASANRSASTMSRSIRTATASARVMRTALQSTATAATRVGTAGNRIRTSMDRATRSTNAMRRAAEQAAGAGSAGLGLIRGALGKVAIAAGAALSLRALVNFGKEATELGSYLTEVQNVVDTVFGDMSYKIDNFASTAIERLGMSETAAKKYASTLGAIAKSSGIAGDDVLTMSTTLTSLAADMASFYNLDTEEVFKKMQSGLTGQVAPLRQLGINMTVANLQAYAMSKGITTAYKDMDNASKMVLRYNYLLDHTKDAQGDFARTSHTWANQVRILQENFNALKTTLGQGFVAALLPVVQALNAVMLRLQGVAVAFRDMVYTITGTKMPETTTSDLFIDAAAAAADEEGAIDDLTESLEDQEEQAKRSVLPFDELNKLGSDSGADQDKGIADYLSLDATGYAQDIEAAMEGASESGGVLAASMDRLQKTLGNIKKAAQQASKAFREGFNFGIGGKDAASASIKEIIDDAKTAGKAVMEIFGDENVQASAASFAERASFALGAITGAGSSLGLTVGRLFVGGLERWLTTQKDRLKRKIADIFDIGAEISDRVSVLAAAVADVFTVFGGNNAKEALGNVFGGAAELVLTHVQLVQRKWNEILKLVTKPITMNIEPLKQVIDDSLGFVAEVTGKAREALEEIGDKVTAFWDEHVSPFVDNVAEGIGKAFGAFLTEYQEKVQPALDSLSEKFSEVWDEYLSPTLDAFLDMCEKILDALTPLWDNYLQPFAEYVGKAIADDIANAVEQLKFLLDLLEPVVDFFARLFNMIGDLAGIYGYYFSDQTDEDREVLRNNELAKAMMFGRGANEEEQAEIDRKWDEYIGDTLALSRELKDAVGVVVDNSQAAAQPAVSMDEWQMAMDSHRRALEVEEAAAADTMAKDSDREGWLTYLRYSIFGDAPMEGVLAGIQELKEAFNVNLSVDIDSETIARASNKGNQKINNRTNPFSR